MSWAVLALVAGIPLYLIRFHVGPLPTTMWEVGLIVVFLLASFRRDVRLDFWKSDALRWPLSLLILAGTIAIFTSPHLVKGLGQWKAIIIDPILLYWLVRSYLVRDPYFRFWLAGAFVAGGAIVAIHAVGEYLRGMTTVDGRVIGIYAADENASPNYLALYLGPLAGLAFGWFIQATNHRRRWSAFALCALLIAAISVSQSRGALVGVALAVLIGLAAGLIKLWPARRTAVIATGSLIFLAAAGIFVPRFLPNLSATQSAGGRLISSNNVRFEIWRTTITTILPRSGFWGLGWANYQEVFTRLTQNRINYPEYIAPLALHPHNFWLMTLVTLGVIGLVAWIWLAIVIWRTPWWASLPLWLGLIVWFVHGMVDTTFYKNDLAAQFFVLVALMVPVSPGARLRQPSGAN